MKFNGVPKLGRQNESCRKQGSPCALWGGSFHRGGGHGPLVQSHDTMSSTTSTCTISLFSLILSTPFHHETETDPSVMNAPDIDTDPGAGPLCRIRGTSPTSHRPRSPCRGRRSGEAVRCAEPARPARFSTVRFDPAFRPGATQVAHKGGGAVPSVEARGEERLGRGWERSGRRWR